ncbi:MAG: hypothetical protein CMJ78_07350 [Planctomycetaceae bacterium]|nr:hypothetical protein [Planctomycetaceae bacterium]
MKMPAMQETKIPVIASALAADSLEDRFEELSDTTSTSSNSSAGANVWKTLCLQRFLIQVVLVIVSHDYSR